PPVAIPKGLLPFAGPAPDAGTGHAARSATAATAANDCLDTAMSRVTTPPPTRGREASPRRQRGSIASRHRPVTGPHEHHQAEHRAPDECRTPHASHAGPRGCVAISFRREPMTPRHEESTQTVHQISIPKINHSVGLALRRVVMCYPREGHRH